jgi:hypothetical protein
MRLPQHSGLASVHAFQSPGAKALAFFTSYVQKCTGSIQAGPPSSKNSSARQRLKVDILHARSSSDSASRPIRSNARSWRIFQAVRYIPFFEVVVEKNVGRFLEIQLPVPIRSFFNFLAVFLFVVLFVLNAEKRLQRPN